MTQNQKLFTLTDEAPLLHLFFLTYCAFTATAGIEMETKDISWLPEFYPFPGVLNEDQKWKMLYLNLEI
jgi:monomeric isocitrate dehydrogenase